MTFDYAGAETTAQTLITFFGQSATLIKGPTITGPDVSNPGEGASTAITIVDLDNVRSNETSVETDKDMKTLYVSTAGLGTTEIEQGDRITVAGRKHEISEVRPVRPAGTVVYYEVDLVR